MKIEIDFGAGGDRNSLYRWLLIGLAVGFVMLIFLLWWQPILSTLSPFALAFVFAYLLNPLIDFISGEKRERLRMHRGFALLILVVLLLAVVVGILGYVIPMIGQESADFARKMRDEVLPILKTKMTERREVWLPFTEAAFWVDLYERNKDLFTFENFAKVVTYGFRGAGMVAEGAGGVWGWMSQTLGGLIS